MFFPTSMHLWRLAAQLLTHFSFLSTNTSSERHNVVDKGTVHYLTLGFAFLKGPCSRQLREEQRTMAERGTSGEGGDNRLGCHTSVTMLWLEESAQGKQGENQDDDCRFCFLGGFFLRNVFPLDCLQITCRCIKAKIQICLKLCSNQILLIVLVDLGIYRYKNTRVLKPFSRNETKVLLLCFQYMHLSNPLPTITGFWSRHNLY